MDIVFENGDQVAIANILKLFAAEDIAPTAEPVVEETPPMRVSSHKAILKINGGKVDCLYDLAKWDMPGWHGRIRTKKEYRSRYRPWRSRSANKAKSGLFTITSNVWSVE